MVVFKMITSGFPSPAKDFREKKLDLEDLLISNPSATFFLKAVGEYSDITGIYEGDILIVDRSLTPKEGDLVVSCSSEKLTIELFSRLYTDPEEYHINSLWGVIAWIIHPSKR